MSETNAAAGLNQRQFGFNLFLVGFLILFLELACIRWFAAKVVFSSSPMSFCSRPSSACPAAALPRVAAPTGLDCFPEWRF